MLWFWLVVVRLVDVRQCEPYCQEDMTGRRVAALCVLLVNLVLVSAERDWSTFLWNKNDLLSVKAKLKESSEFAAAAAALKSAASHALDVPPLS